jgi:hypothetical protein
MKLTLMLLLLCQLVLPLTARAEGQVDDEENCNKIFSALTTGKSGSTGESTDQPAESTGVKK